jgi:protein-glutamine gamma-glutamyltransferase
VLHDMTLTFEKQFLIGSHLLALVGVLALATTHEVSTPYVAIAVLGISWSLWREWRGRGPQISGRAANIAIFAALFAALSPVVLRGASPVRPIAEFLLVLAGLKFAAAKENRDWLQIYSLSFFHLLAASALTVEPIFAALFLAYLVLAPCVLVLFQLRREITGALSGHRLEEEPFVEPSLFRSIAATTVVLFFSTLLIFVIFPRVGAGYFAAPFSGGQVLTGFSEEVGLGTLSTLKQDETVALRVAVDRPELFSGARWRGAALDHFDGRQWRRRPQEQRPLMRPEVGLFTSSERAPGAALVREEVILEPQDTSALFVAGRPIEIRGRFGEVAIDGIGNLRVIRPTGVRIRYQVLASLAPRRTPPTAETLALPPIDPRIRDLARELVKGAGGAAAQADALLGYFRHGFHYTLEPGDSDGEDPLVHFLFKSRSGFCEHFASAYAVMLRAVGIPSLVVNGYAGGEWNPYGNYFVIRQSDAHSWVEAYMDGAWRTYDPTPPSAPHLLSVRRRIADAIDALEMRWYRYVINYTLEDQAEAALSLRDTSRRVWERLSRDWWRALKSRGAAGTVPPAREAQSVAVAFGIFVLVVVAWLWRSRRTADAFGVAALSVATRCYIRLLGALAARGLEKRPAETPLEFCQRVAPRLDGQAEAVARATALYHQARFSGRSLAPGELEREIDSVVAALASRMDPSRVRTE